MANGEQTTYDPRMGPLDGSPMLVDHMQRRAAGTEEDAFRAEMLARIMGGGQNGNAAPVPRPQAPPRPLGTARQELARAIQSGMAPAPQPAPSAPRGAPGAPPAGGLAPMDALRGLVSQQIPSGVGGALNAQGTSTISLGNMIASNGATPAVGPNDVMRAQRQKAIANLVGVAAAETEIKKNATANERLNFDKLKFAFERGDKRADAVMGVVEEFGKNMVNVPDRAKRTTAFWRDLGEQLELLPQGTDPQGITALAGNIAAKHASGARAERGGVNVNIGGEKLQTEFEKTLGKQYGERAGEVMASREKATNNLANVNRMMDLLPSIDTGPIARFFPTMQAVASDLGLNTETIAKKAGININKVANAQEYDRLARNMAIEAVGQFKGSTSDRELNYAQTTVANLGKSEEGNMLALATMQVFFQRSEKYAAELERRLADSPTDKTFRDWQKWVQEQGRNSPLAEEVKVRLGETRVTPTTSSGGPTDYIWTPEGGLQPNPARQ